MLVMGHVSGCSIRKELLSFSVDVEGGFVEGGFIRHPPEVPMHWPECLAEEVLWSGSWALAACHGWCCFSTQHCSPTHLAVASSLMPFPLAALAQTHFVAQTTLSPCFSLP